jgi:putative transcriptional regulator
MIKFHPDDNMLHDFVQAKLPTSVSVAVSIHVEMCEDCRHKVSKLTESQAEQEFHVSQKQNSEFDDIELSELELGDMIDFITRDETKDKHVMEKRETYRIGEKDHALPQALTHLNLGSWQSIGPLSRSRVNLEDGELRSSILHIDAGGDVPQHTHNGFELTLLLDGSFSDDMGTYHKGDFILLDQNHQHQPKTEEGCVCYTVVSDALHFTQGMSRLLNPIGKLIY